MINLKNLRELVTALGILTAKNRTTKNKIIRIMDMFFRGLSNALDPDQDSVKFLEKINTAEEFM